MSVRSVSVLASRAGAIALALLPLRASPSPAAVERWDDMPSEAVAWTGSASNAADLELHYAQEDGPGSGHIRVTLTPETRALTVEEARAAAQQAFLGALDNPALGDELRRIRVVVRLTPASHPDLDAARQEVLFVHKGGREWSVLPGD